jgi:hypothetical protein
METQKLAKWDGLCLETTRSLEKGGADSLGWRDLSAREKDAFLAGMKHAYNIPTPLREPTHA